MASVAWANEVFVVDLDLDAGEDDEGRVLVTEVGDAFGRDALMVVGERQAVEPLCEALGDRRLSVRHAAAWALCNIGDARALRRRGEGAYLG